jgi:hypothetical protein
MADKIRKWKDQAAAAMRKGKYDKALTLFRQVVEQDPEDFSCHNNIGYILRRMKKSDEAIKVFEDLAEAYAERGFLLKAIATCKVVLDIDPEHKKIQTQLADLYASRSGGAPKPEVKVMAPQEGDVQVGDENIIPLAPIELDTLELDTAPTLDIQRTTPVEHVAEEEPEEQEEAAPEPVPLDPSMIELEPAPEEPEPESVQEPIQEPEPPAEEEKLTEAAKRSSAMDALLSRVGIGGKGGAAPREEPKEAPEPDLPDLDEPALLDDVERLLDQLESDEEDTELPQMMKSSHLIAALIRLLLKKDVLTQEELLEELKKR